MQKYTKIVMDFYGYDISDFIPCFICGKRATEIHHIMPKSLEFKDINNIYNLIPICRSDHEFYSAKKYRDMLKKIVRDKVDKIKNE